MNAKQQARQALIKAENSLLKFQNANPKVREELIATIQDKAEQLQKSKYPSYRVLVAN